MALDEVVNSVTRMISRKNCKEFFNFYTVVKSSNLQYLVLHTFLFNFGFVMAEVLSELDLLGVLPA